MIDAINYRKHGSLSLESNTIASSTVSETRGNVQSSPIRSTLHIHTVLVCFR